MMLAYVTRSASGGIYIFPRKFANLFVPAVYTALHSVNLFLVHKLLEAVVEVSPPVKEERVADELEPGGELEARVVKQSLELVGADILGSLDLVGAGVEVDVGLDEENVVD